MNDKENIWKIYEAIDTTVQHNRVYPDIPKTPKSKPEGALSSMQLDDFLKKNKDNKTTTELVTEYFKQVAGIFKGTDNTLKVNILLTLYSFAELSGYREGLAEGRNIAHDAGKFMDNLHTEAIKTDDAILTEAAHKCPKCSKSMGKHHNEEKSKKGYKYCGDCGVTYSPEGTKGMNSWDDKNNGTNKAIKENEHWLHSKGNPESEDSDEDKAFDRRMAQKKWGYTNKKPKAKPRDLDKEMEARREAADQKEESKKTGADQYDESIKKTDFEVFIEALRQFGFTNKVIGA